MNGIVYIVGAGPGDPELITVKALKILKIADVIIYDRLVPQELLEGLNAELIYVGKELGDAKLQDYINELLVRKAKEGKKVVRLKGGDPFVFGRGEEECIYVLRHGIKCEIVPGVTSAIAVPTYARIPVTSRLVESSSGFTVITGTTKDGGLISEEYIPRKGTIIILMGIHVIDELTKVLMKVRSGKEKVAVIEKGTTKQQRVFTGTLNELPEIVKREEVKSPAVIVIGETVSLMDLLTLKKEM
ncbi:MAG: uroporphyrinogen-III C-methyltransferase [Sulfolobaceae archaeon]